MPFDWTEDMPAVCTHPEIETHQRLALAMAAGAFDAIMDQGRERPSFDGGSFVAPTNDTAHELLAAIEEALTLASEQTGLEIDGAQRQQMIAVAARGADQVWRESVEAGVTMERYWPRFVLRFGIHRGRRPKIKDPFPPEPVVLERAGELAEGVTIASAPGAAIEAFAGGVGVPVEPPGS